MAWKKVEGDPFASSPSTTHSTSPKLTAPSGEKPTGTWRKVEGDPFANTPAGTPGILETIGDYASEFGRQLESSLILAVKGQKGISVADQDAYDAFVVGARKSSEEFVRKYSADDRSFLGLTMKDAAESMSSLPFSVVSGVPGAAAGAGTFIATKSPTLAFSAGGAASGAVAYRIDSGMVMQQYLSALDDEAREKYGSGLTKEEEAYYRSQFESQATKHGLYEAIPEAIGNIGEVGLLLTPLKKTVGKHLATKIMGKLGGLYGTELATETVSQQGQQPIEVSAGLADGPARSMTSASDWWKSAKEVAPQVFILSTLMGGVGGGVSVYSSRKKAIALKNAVNEGRLDVLPDDVLNKVATQADDLVGSRPWDKELKTAAAALQGELVRRTGQPDMTGEPAQTRPEGVPAKPQTATSGPLKDRGYTALPSEFYQEFKTALETGADKAGAAFSLDSAQSMVDAYKKQLGADPASVASLQGIVDGHAGGKLIEQFNRRVDTNFYPNDKAALEDRDTIVKTFPHLADDANRAFIRYQGNKMNRSFAEILEEKRQADLSAQDEMNRVDQIISEIEEIAPYLPPEGQGKTETSSVVTQASKDIPVSGEVSAEAPAPFEETEDGKALEAVRKNYSETENKLKEMGFEISKQMPQSDKDEAALMRQGYYPLILKDGGFVENPVGGVWAKAPEKTTPHTEEKAETLEELQKQLAGWEQGKKLYAGGDIDLGLPDRTADYDRIISDIKDKIAKTAPQGSHEAPAPAGLTLADFKIKVEKGKTKTGIDVWNVSGDTRPHADTMKKLGAKWYRPKRVWSFYDADPTDKILAGFGVSKSEEPKKEAPGSDYFDHTETSKVVPVKDIILRQEPRTTSIETAKTRMAAAKDGKGNKRKPLSVVKRPDGKYKVVDGNATLHALQDLNEEHAVVEIVDTPIHRKVKNLDDLRNQAKEALPELKEIADVIARDHNGKAVFRPGEGIKRDESIEFKVKNETAGAYDQVIDTAAATVVFNDIEDLTKAFNKIKHDPRVYAARNRFDRPLPGGYRDVNIKIGLSNGHVGEIQLHLAKLREAKEAIGHPLYKLHGGLHELEDLDTAAIERDILDLSRDIYDSALRDAKSFALSSEHLSALYKIWTALSPLISTRLEPSILNNFMDALSKTKGTFSLSKNSKPVSFLDILNEPPSDENIPTNQDNVKEPADLSAKTTQELVSDIFSIINDHIGNRGSISGKETVVGEGLYQRLKPYLSEIAKRAKEKALDVKAYMFGAVDSMPAGAAKEIYERAAERYVDETLDNTNKKDKLQTQEGGDENGTVNVDAAPSEGTDADDRDSAEGQSAANVRRIEAEGNAEGVRRSTGTTDDGELRDGSESTSGEDTESSGEVRGSDQTEPGVHDGRKPGVARNPGDVSRIRRSGTDYRISDGELTRSGSWKKTAESNLDAIEIVKTLEREKRRAKPEEQAILVKYTGWGSSELANKMFPGFTYAREIRIERADPEWRSLVERMQSLLSEEEIKTAARSTQYAHYTSESVIRSIYKAMEKFGFPGGKILEPGMGIGHFLGLLPDQMKKTSTYTGIEMDHATALIAKNLYPRSNVLQADYTKQAFPNDFYDLAIGNPPFSSTKILTDPDYKKYRFSLHDYFFAKSLDKVRPGGLLVFITSRYTMDRSEGKARNYLAEHADLIGAIRLPQTAFKQNAGTEVVTDVLFFKKREKGAAPAGEAWSTLAEVATEDGPAQVNEYFAAHPDMVLGRHSLKGKMYRNNEYTVLPLDGEIEDHFAAAVEKLPSGVYNTTTLPAEEKKKLVVERDYNPTNKKEGGLYVANGKLMIVDKGSGVPVDSVHGKLKEADIKWLKDYTTLRDALKQAQYDQLTDGDWEASLKALQHTYDTFTKKHGHIRTFTSTFKKEHDEDGNEVEVELRRFKNERLLKVDVESALASALEVVKEDGKIVKAPVLLGRTIKKPERQAITTAHDALAVCLDEVGTLDIKHIAQLINATEDQVINDLGETIFEEPGRDGYLLADEYLSGDVVKKLEEAIAAASVDRKYKRNVDALEKVQPEPLSAKDISVVMGANWVPVEYYTHFAQEVVGLKGLGAIYTAADNNWKIGPVKSDDVFRSNTQRSSGSARQGLRGSVSDWGTSDRGANEIMEAVLNNATLQIKRSERFSDGSTKTWTDETATAEVNNIAKKMRQRFASWVWEDAERATNLLDIYNKKFNNLAGRSFNGEHLTLPGVSLMFNLHPHQKRAIWRIIQTGNTYLAHAVGSGKTIEMIAAGMEMRRLGQIKKPLYVVPNHMLQQFADEFQQLYPLAHIMVADETNFHTENRRRFVAQAALNNPDAIVMTHSSFGLIKAKQETITPIRDKFMADLYACLAELEDETDDKRRIKQMEQRIEQAEQRFDSVVADTGKDNVVTFEDMGVDFLFVDEAHNFRKLDFATNRKAKGIDSNGSRRAIDLFIKIAWLKGQNKGRSHVFASGTPITNTLGELYSLMRFFIEGQMESEGIDAFDAWANTFGSMALDTEMNAAGRYEIVERFAEFVNVPELMSRVRQFMDILTSSQLGDAVTRPEIEGGRPEIVITPPTEELKDYQKNVLEPRIITSRKWKPSRDEKGNPDPLINIITDGRLASIDMRYVRPRSPNNPQSKLNKFIDGIIESYQQNKDIEFTNPVTKEVLPGKGATQIVFYNHGFGKQVAHNRGFDARSWVMTRLKEAGIPASEVAWIEDYDTAAKKAHVFKEMVIGKKKILIGSAKKMGTGVNVQSRLKALHYLDPPWFPADVEQPDGRILRQGNMNKTISIKRYATKGSYDATMWQMVARKSAFIEQSFHGDKSVRKLTDISETSQYAMASALASGDERAIHLVGLRAAIQNLHSLKIAHEENQRKLLRNRRERKSDIETRKTRIAQLKEAKKKVPEYIREINGVLDGKSYDNRDEFGEALITKYNKTCNELMEKHADDQNGLVGERPLAKLNGIDLIHRVRKSGTHYGASLILKVTPDVETDLENGPSISTENISPRGLVARAVNYLNEIGRQIDSVTNFVKDDEEEIFRINRKLGAPFPEEQELAEKIAEEAALSSELVAEGAAAEVTEAETNAAGILADRDSDAVYESTEDEAADEEDKDQYSVSGRDSTNIDAEPYTPTLSEIQEIFKGQDVNQDGNAFVVKIKNGKTVRIASVDHIAMDKISFGIGYSRGLKQTDFIAGKYAKGKIEIHKQAAGNWTLTHESEHFMEDAGIITSTDIAALRGHIKRLVSDKKFQTRNKNDIGGAEDRASFVADQLSNGEKPAGITGRVIERIRQFIDRIVEVFGKRTAGAVVRDIQSGRLFNKDMENPPGGNAASYSIRKSPSFKKWFGDSKVVGKNGDPLVVYHTGPFDDSLILSGSELQKRKGREEDSDRFNHGIYFTQDPAYSSEYGKDFRTGKPREGAAMYPVYLSIQNPLIIKNDKDLSEIGGGYKDISSLFLSRESLIELKRKGYDGIINEVWDEIVAFEPTQIKSATANVGTYDVGNPDIRYAVQEILENKAPYKKQAPAAEVTVDKNISPAALRRMISDETDAILQTALSKLPRNVTHMSFLEKFFKSPEYYSHPGLARIVRLFMRDRNEIYHEYMNYLMSLDDPDAAENTLSEITTQLKNKGLTTFQVMKGETSKDYKDLQRIIDEGDTTWERDPDQTLEEQMAAFERYIKGWASEDAIRVWKYHRESYDRALELMTAQMRQMIEQIEENAAFMNQSPDYREMYETLKGAMASMETWKGFYAPRLRQGNWVVYATRGRGEDREAYREHRFSEWSANRLATKLKNEGWDVRPVSEIQRLPEDVYQDLKTANVAKAIETAIGNLTRRSLIEGDVISNSFRLNEELLQEVADMIRARGYRSSMIHRKPGSNVVRGYITDPMERNLIYLNNMARGMAKAKVAQQSIKELMGYEVNGRRFGGISPDREPRVYTAAKDYIEEQLRNLDSADRFIGWAKSLATLKFLGFSVRSALVNTTAIVTTAPTAIHEYVGQGKVGFMKINRIIGKSGADFARLMSGGKLADRDEQSFMDEVKKLGWDDPQYTRDALGGLSKLHNRVWSTLMDGAMWMFGKTEQWNRGTTMLAAYRIARGLGKSHEEAAELAKTASDKAHGVYGRATLPAIAWGRNPAAKVAQMLYVYQKFSHNYLQMMGDLLLTKKNYKAFFYGLLAPVVVSGLSAWPLKDQTIIPLIGLLMTALGLKDKDEDTEKWIWDVTREYLGSGAEIAGRYGLAGAIGGDISGSLTIGVGIPKDIYEWTGAIGGVVKEAVTAAREVRQGRFARATEHLLPSGFANVARAVRERGEGITTERGNRVWNEKGRPLEPTVGETALRSMGVRSARQATLSTRLYEAKAQAAKFDDKKKDIYERYRAYLASTKKDPKAYRQIRLDIREFNAKVKDLQLVEEVSPITYESLRRQVKGMTTATKKEKGMLQ